jgi:hypothetical protein
MKNDAEYVAELIEEVVKCEEYIEDRLIVAKRFIKGIELTNITEALKLIDKSPLSGLVSVTAPPEANPMVEIITLIRLYLVLALTFLLGGLVVLVAVSAIYWFEMALNMSLSYHDLALRLSVPTPLLRISRPKVSMPVFTKLTFVIYSLLLES